MKIESLSVSYGDRTVFSDFSIDFPEDEITVILGPSGVGKTTLLNSLAVGSVSYVFQEPRLIPWHTVERNLSLVLPGDQRAARDRAREYLAKVGLGDRLRSFPDRLSGGERQRVSIARAFAYPAPLLLMDEPFQSQDPATKAQLIDLVRALRAEEHRTVIAVTHDLREAAALADRAVVLAGRPARIALDLPGGAGLESRLGEILSLVSSIG